MLHTTNYIKRYDFFRTKYGEELLIDVIRLESLAPYIDEPFPHSLSYFDITLITNGEGTLTIDGYTYPLRAGKLIFTSPGQSRDWDVETTPTGYVIIFEEEFLSAFFNDSQFVSKLGYFNSSPLPQELILSETDTRNLAELLIYAEKEMDSFVIKDKHILRAILYQVLVWIKRKYYDTYSSDIHENINIHVKQFIKLVEERYREFHCVNQYADILSITPCHLNDLCKQNLSISAKQYIQSRIVLEAKRLLQYTSLPITSIAFELGFVDSSYFVRRFKILVGQTPSNFRKLGKP